MAVTKSKYRMQNVMLGLALVLLSASGVDKVQASTTQPLKSAFQPHRALYQMELGSTTQGSEIVDARGTMFYRFEPQCDGWEVETRVALMLNYGTTGDAPEVVETTWTFNSFESFDGMDFTYAVDHKRNGLLQEAFAGEAGKDSHGGGASFNDEEFKAVDLPSGTLFPAEHLLRLLTHARTDNGPIKKVVFDGASTDNPYEVNAYVIGRVHNGRVMTGNQLSSTDNPRKPLFVGATSAKPETPEPVGVWRVRMAYFPLMGHMDLPEFELEIDYRENGIAERIIQDFGNFTLNLTPDRIEFLPRQECN